MKTLFYTSIYGNLWGTEFGGRPSRNLHYKYSLLTLLNMNADKFICFTSKEEIDELKNWFHTINNISTDKLEFIEFDLYQTPYFNDIKRIKNIENVMKMDRSYEVQYNKFFWLEMIPDLESYDRVFWIDAGLSHGGIIHSKYSYGTGLEKNYSFTIYNETLLNKFIDLTEDKILLLSKNNTGRFYWSTTVPTKYYKEYNNSEHIIGGLFGGKVENMLMYKLRFVTLLRNLLNNESELYFEELLMSCLYQNYKSDFVTLTFDDWYNRTPDQNSNENVKYFYNMFETSNVCVCCSCIEIGDGNRYTEKAKILIETYLTHTPFDILILTNRMSEFEDINDNRVKIVDYDSNFSEKIISQSRFNMHLKRYPIRLAKELGYDIIYFHDCDCYIVGWDNESFMTKCSEDFDVAFVSHAHPQLGGLRKTYKHFQDKIDNEFGDLYFDELDNSPNPAETRVIFKNNEKLDKFLHFWDLISERNRDFFTYHDGVYFGTSAIYSGMKMTGVNQHDKFSSFCRISHGDKVLDYFGHTLSESEYNKQVEHKAETNNKSSEVIHYNYNSLSVSGSFYYKEIQVQQNPRVTSVFKEFLEKFQPDLIIEIGTGFGGMTLILNDILTELSMSDTKIVSFDIVNQINVFNDELNENIKFYIADIFKPYYDDLNEEYKSLITQLIVDSSRTLVLCDGSNNTKEFNVLSKYIKPGDVIMVHDYARNEEIFNSEIKDEIWNWFEVSESDLTSSSQTYNLESFMPELMESVAWGSKIKKT